MDALSWDRFRTELLDALPDHIAERIDAEEWTSMKRRVADYAKTQLGGEDGA